MIEEARRLLRETPAAADRLLSELAATASASRDVDKLRQIWPDLSEARQLRRQRAAAGRIDLHTHTTASDGEMSVEKLLCEHFRCGQILIDDHNIIDSLAPARQLVRERDLELDVFLGIEVICTHHRRAFEFHAIAPRLSDEFTELCKQHRAKWNRACERFVDDLCTKQNFFNEPLWRQIIDDFSVGGPLTPVLERYDHVRSRLLADSAARENYLRNNQTFDMGNLWHTWGLAEEGDPPMLAHRFFAAMRCYALNAYRDELGDWFDYRALASRFHQVGCVVSHNHPNYWDEDFVGELPHELQTEWVREFAADGVIDALEVWSPPFASQRVPTYWQEVCEQLQLIPMAGTDCHSGREQEFGGTVDNHPEIPPMLYQRLTARSVDQARQTTGWEALTAWHVVLAIDYAHEEALQAVAALLEGDLL